MTDLLTRDPNDTGEIPTTVDPGLTTANLAPYAAGLGPFLRKGELTEEVPYEPQTIAVVDDFAPRPGTPGPDPTPPFPPPPPPPTPGYVGRHRAPDDMPATVPAERFGALRSVLASAWARVRGAM
jgi:hypothetical protein